MDPQDLRGLTQIFLLQGQYRWGSFGMLANLSGLARQTSAAPLPDLFMQTGPDIMAEISFRVGRHQP